MANRTLGTRQKQVFRGPAKGPAGRVVPRNPLVLPAAQRKAGPHGKSESAERQAAERRLNRQLEKLAEEGDG
ncbi:MAG TPA: hypothetical protein PKE01_02055 [Rhodocyclaceae bacterium]|nr:hypothetical protein [Rhodocyclaceae bacterium]HMW53128.1 hypothetical protein [Rhodocyclaceae bacterium]HNC80620.1 hypothetical protein [Rhodocyclaceae bacterium]HND25392.1 hypothetical protein [Rhodocyclaceae bacterium]HNE17090.1 hypothetical protein [Rhodocyclaceae bacterium]